MQLLCSFCAVFSTAFMEIQDFIHVYAALCSFMQNANLSSFYAALMQLLCSVTARFMHCMHFIEIYTDLMQLSLAFLQPLCSICQAFLQLFCSFFCVIPELLKFFNADFLHCHAFHAFFSILCKIVSLCILCTWHFADDRQY